MKIELKIDRSDIEVVYQSWNMILKSESNLGVIFYSRLFEKYPELRPLFKNSIVDQADKLIATFTFLLTKLHSGQTFVGDVQHLASRHATYGVTDHHYRIVGEVLIRSLNEVLGDTVGDDVYAIWAKAYQTISEIMIKASHDQSITGISNVA